MSLPTSVCSAPSAAAPARSRAALSDSRWIAADAARKMARSPARCMPCTLVHFSASIVRASAAPIPSAVPTSQLAGSIAATPYESTSGRTALEMMPEAHISATPGQKCGHATGSITPRSTFGPAAAPSRGDRCSSSQRRSASACSGSESTHFGGGGKSSSTSGRREPRHASAVAHASTLRLRQLCSSGLRRAARGGAAAGAGAGAGAGAARGFGGGGGPRAASVSWSDSSASGSSALSFAAWRSSARCSSASAASVGGREIVAASSVGAPSAAGAPAASRKAAMRGVALARPGVKRLHVRLARAGQRAVGRRLD